MALNGLKYFFADFDRASEALLWQLAEQHFCGGGLSAGADMSSLRQLLGQLEAAPRGERLVELL
eukprot:7408885-Pyramimonas_sp.AAC.1